MQAGAFFVTLALVLNITNLSKSYAKSDIKAVDNLTLQLREGEIFGFLGPNGAGKTTTIKALTGILPFEEGQISICGLDIQRQSQEAKRNIGYVSDTHVLYDRLTGREYVDFLADIHGISLGDRKARAEKMLEALSLTSSFDAAIKTYSHGMKQKIAVIGALIHNPKLWVLDEPLTGLDPQSAFTMKELMRAHANAGNTVMFSTHILEAAEKLCDRVGIIVKGQLVKIGSVEDIMQAAGDKSLEEVFLSIAGAGGVNNG